MIINNIRRFFYGIKIRKPINDKGEWVGWSKEEVIAHLSSFKDPKPLKEKFLALKEKLHKKEG